MTFHRASAVLAALVSALAVVGGLAPGAGMSAAMAAAPSSHCTPTVTNLGYGSWMLPPELQQLIDPAKRLDVPPALAGSPTLDMDGDHVPDTVSIAADHTVTITRGDGVLVINSPDAVLVKGADLDGDGHDEAAIYASEAPQGFQAEIGLVPGTTPPGTLSGYGSVYGVLSEDVTGDGLPDLLSRGGADQWFSTNGKQALEDMVGPSRPVQMVYASSDLDGDGLPDLATAADFGSLQIELSSGAVVPMPLSHDLVEVRTYRTADGTIYLVTSSVAGDMLLYRLDIACNDPFVRAAYNDLLSRTPTDQELNLSLNALSEGASRVQFARSLASRPEWLTTIVTGLYHQTLGREPDAAGLQYWIGQLSGTPPKRTVPGVTGSFYASPEYYDSHGGTDDGWVTALYGALLHREPDPLGLQYWVEQVAQQGRTRVAVRFFQTGESAHDRVTALYQQLLHRAPDPLGLDYWAGRIVTDGALSLAANLIASPEYYLAAQARFP